MTIRTKNYLTGRLRGHTATSYRRRYPIRNAAAGTVCAAESPDTGDPVETEVIYFCHLGEGKVAGFWLLSDTGFDHRAT